MLADRPICRHGLAWSEPCLHIWSQLFSIPAPFDLTIFLDFMKTEQLWSMYSGQLRLYIASRIQGPAVDDILQQVFLKVHKNKHTIQHKKAVKSRLYTISQHCIIDRYRKEYGGKHGSMSDMFRDSLENDQSTSDQKKILSNISSCLLPMIGSLNDQSRDVMHRYLDPDTTLESIADELGISLSNVKVIVHRAKKKLKQKYQECCYQYTDGRGTIIDTWCSRACGCNNSVIRVNGSKF